jgi:HEAT repeat protein
MSYYSLPQVARKELAARIAKELRSAVEEHDPEIATAWFDNIDTFIRKAAYIAIGRLWKSIPALHTPILSLLSALFRAESPRVRQTVVNAFGEIAMTDFDEAAGCFRKALFDEDHSVRNAVIGSLKKSGEKNPSPCLAFAQEHIRHPDKEIRREICHGIELRGRTHPQDILPLLRQLQHDKENRVRNTLVHVLGQISYKKGCLEIVAGDLLQWENKGLVKDAVDEIIDVHERYKNFAVLSREQAINLVRSIGL